VRVFDWSDAVPIFTRAARPASSSALLREIGVVALVPEAWGPRYETRHQVLTRLARTMNVAWVEPAHGWRETPRALRKRMAAGGAHPLPGGGFTVHRPEVWLPKMYRPEWLARYTFFQRIRNARARLRRQGSRVFVCYVWRAEFGQALDASPPWDLTLYHIDDEYSFSELEQPIDPSERRLIERVDQVFVHVPGLLARKGQFNPRSTLVPNGVDFATFSRPREMPADLGAIPSPRIGYVGYLKRSLDWPLLDALARRQPGWHFVFVGATRANQGIEAAVEGLRTLPNVHFLGPKTTEQIAAYPQHLDVCMMPYGDSFHARFYYPLKLHEYLAGGQPVVASTYVEILRNFDGVIRLARSVDGWVDAIAMSLDGSDNTIAERRRRQDLAREFDWDRLVQRVERVLIERLMETPRLAQDDALVAACRARLGSLHRIEYEAMHAG
jgi:glycosyltransferase involved in cell wall biosynthesis